jgi:hypothetical protein
LNKKKLDFLNTNTRHTSLSISQNRILVSCDLRIHTGSYVCQK